MNRDKNTVGIGSVAIGTSNAISLGVGVALGVLFGWTLIFIALLVGAAFWAWGKYGSQIRKSTGMNSSAGANVTLKSAVNAAANKFGMSNAISFGVGVVLGVLLGWTIIFIAIVVGLGFWAWTHREEIKNRVNPNP